MQLVDCSPFAIAVVSVRSFGIAAALPLGDSMGFISKLMLAVGLSLAITPLVTLPDDLSGWVMLSEFVVGLLLGSPFRVLVDLSEAFGELIDTARGQTIAAVNDPLNGHAVSDLATLCKVASTAVAMNLGGLEVCVHALRESYRAVPIGAIRDVGVFSHGLLVGGSQLLASMLVACAIWLVSFLIIDLISCFSARVSRGLAFSSTGAVLKTIVTGFLLSVLVVSSERGGGLWLAGRLKAFLGAGVAWAIP